MLLLYRLVTRLSGPLLHLLLLWRQQQGKEDRARLNERKGQASRSHPQGSLVWIHAASVGEAQSALILIEKISANDPNLSFLVSSGTKTSADLMAKRLPANAIHQFYPLDHPKWVSRFLDHWKPDLILWMESELWPNMLRAIKKQEIPAVLINARMSDQSFNRWKFFQNNIKEILSAFSIILAQTKKDKERFQSLGALNVSVSDNLKYSAAPLPVDQTCLSNLKEVIGARPVWLYASTHEGEETLAGRIHTELGEDFSDLLTIIVPRHPERRDDISHELNIMGLKTVFRGEEKILPAPETEIYVVDTLGELGLFYSLSPIAVIGRSFSNDGGGGHNPIEAAQLDCAVLTGPNIQYQTQLFQDMFDADAAKQLTTEDELYKQIKLLLTDERQLQNFINNAKKFADSKKNIVQNIMNEITSLLPIQNKKAA